MSNSERYFSQPTVYVSRSFRFDVMLCSNLGNENFDVGHIKCSPGPQVPHPWIKAKHVCF